MSPAIKACRDGAIYERETRPIAIHFGFRIIARDIANERPEHPPVDGSDVEPGAEDGIEWIYRRRLCGLRFLRRHERRDALRAARDEKEAAYRALRERRAVARHARVMLRRLMTPENA